MAVPISRNSGDTVSDWMLKAISPHAESAEAKDALQIKTEKDMVEAKSKIEECAKSGKKLFVDKGMTEQQKSELKEYAQVCGVKESDIVHVSETDKLVAGLKSEEKVTKKDEEDKDPFNAMKGFAPESSFDKRPMQKKAEPASKMSDKGRSNGSVARVGSGTETYESQRVVGVRPGENSIAAPDSIRQLADSKEKSSKDTIKEQNQKKREATVFNAKQWEKDLAETLPKGYKASGEVKLTAAAPEKTRHVAAPGQHSMFDERDVTLSIPDKTNGEKIAEENVKRKASIQRPEVKDDKSWDRPASSNRPVISDILFEELKKRLAK